MLLLMLPILYLTFAVMLGGATVTASYQSTMYGTPVARPWLVGAQAAIAPWTQAAVSAYGPLPQHLLRRFEWNRIALDGWFGIRSSLDFAGSSNGWGTISRAAFALICTLSACPVGFVLLPASRRVAKVRWRHIGRIAAYGLLIAVIPIAVDLFDQLPGVPYRWFGGVTLIMQVVVFGFATCWWAAAVRNYLRMPHAWGIAVYVVIFAYLFQWLIWQLIDMAIVLLK